tara:strand:- start:265 stop:696 length:432 start_codon:yes stop_codon:yes gene_type:complete
MVTVHYKGTLEDGTQFDSSVERGSPIQFIVGKNQMIPGFENAVLGMTVGSVTNVTLPSDQAYGDYDESKINNVPKTVFPEGFEYVINATVHGQSPTGPILAKILSEQEEDVTLDFNHPLAGKTLNFEIELVGIEEVTSEGTDN